MKLSAFRLQNYKRIQDTGWVDCGDLMVFVGKNESGKTALMRGLSKLNPTDGEKYNGLKEFPHGRYTDEFNSQDWPAASGGFELDDDDREELAAIWPALEDVQTVEVTRHYSDKLTVGFHPQPTVKPVSQQEWKRCCGEIASEIEQAVAPDGHGDDWGPKKDALTKWFRGQEKQATETDLDLQTAEAARSQISGQMTEQWSKDLLSPHLSALGEIVGRLSAGQAAGEARQWVADNMPFFLYFGEYEVLDSAIYVPEFVQRVKSDDKSPKTRVQRALFRHVGADIDELAKLGHHEHGKGPQLAAQARDAPRRFVERESHYLWGRRHLLTVVEEDTKPSVSVDHKRITLRVRPGSTVKKRASVIHEWHKSLLHEVVRALIQKWQPKLGVTVERYFLQRMKTKWGSCNHDAGHIRLNTELVKKPKDLVEYVVVHEMVHLIEPTHSEQFVSILTEHYPSWREARAELNELPLAAEVWNE